MRALLFPGQGSQAVGMGADLFARFPAMVRMADEILGFSVAKLCLENPEGRLSRTRYAQPAIFVVNALSLAALGGIPGETGFAAGHSLGEYNALLAAGVFDFETGLALVKKRGELFADAVQGGGMAAVLGLTVPAVRAVLAEACADAVEVANLNSARQVVLSGPRARLEDLRSAFERAGCALYHPLDVSGPFHSSHMRPAKSVFADFARQFRFADPAFPVISNVTARPYAPERTADFLVEQIDHPVRWAETIRYLFRNGVAGFLEIGHGTVLTKLCNAIRRETVHRRDGSALPVSS